MKRKKNETQAEITIWCQYCGKNKATETFTDGETLRKVYICKECKQAINKI